MDNYQQVYCSKVKYLSIKQILYVILFEAFCVSTLCHRKRKKLRISYKTANLYIFLKSTWYNDRCHTKKKSFEKLSIEKGTWQKKLFENQMTSVLWIFLYSAVYTHWRENNFIFRQSVMKTPTLPRNAAVLKMPGSKLEVYWHISSKGIYQNLQVVFVVCAEILWYWPNAKYLTHEIAFTENWLHSRCYNSTKLWHIIWMCK